MRFLSLLAILFLIVAAGCSSEQKEEAAEAVEGAKEAAGDVAEKAGGVAQEAGEAAHDVAEAAGILARDGFPSVQSGRSGSPESGDAYNYVDVKPLRAIWGLTHYDEGNLGVEPDIYPR